MLGSCVPHFGGSGCCVWKGGTQWGAWRVVRGALPAGLGAHMSLPVEKNGIDFTCFRVDEMTLATGERQAGNSSGEFSEQVNVALYLEVSK